MKRVFSFGNGVAEGAGLGKETLGGKGAGLAEMTALGIPVPPGFTIETSVCADYSRGASLDGIRAEVESALRRLEHDTDRRFGDPENPLLVSVRSGARSSMPGMMDTILNLGLTSRTVQGLAKLSGERFALDCRRRFLEMYSDVVLRVPDCAVPHPYGSIPSEARPTRHDLFVQVGGPVDPIHGREPELRRSGDRIEQVLDEPLPLFEMPEQAERT